MAKNSKITMLRDRGKGSGLEILHTRRRAADRGARSHSANGAEALRIGAAAVVITPPVGTPMAGYYSERAAEGVHDTLFAKAIVLEPGGTKAALVALDLISTTSRPWSRPRARRSRRPPASRAPT